MPKNTKQSALAFMDIVIACALAAPTQAATKDDNSNASLEEVVVTATKQTVNIQQVLLSGPRAFPWMHAFERRPFADRSRRVADRTGRGGPRLNFS